jgi:hypothetical protein
MDCYSEILARCNGMSYLLQCYLGSTTKSLYTSLMVGFCYILVLSQCFSQVPLRVDFILSGSQSLQETEYIKSTLVINLSINHLLKKISI